MTIVETKTRKWGNSLGIIIPKDVVEEEHLKEHGKVKILILKDSTKALKETFGIAKGKLKSQQLKDELREDLYD